MNYPTPKASGISWRRSFKKPNYSFKILGRAIFSETIFRKS